MVRLSIIVPHFNSPKLLGTLLDSIDNKAWIEVIVVDDHSDQASLKQFNELANTYPSVHFLPGQQGKKGPGVARNLGIENSQGEWVLFADCDDFFTEGAFELIESKLSSISDVIYFIPKSVKLNVLESADSDRHNQYENIIRAYEKTPKKELFFRFYAPWSKMIKRDLLNANNIRFDDYIGGEDNLFSLKVAFYSERVETEKASIYCVTESNDSLTQQKSFLNIQNNFMSLTHYNDFLQKNGLKEYQAPMLGWIVGVRKYSFKTMLSWIWLCLVKGYPLNIMNYLSLIRSRKTRA